MVSFISLFARWQLHSCHEARIWFWQMSNLTLPRSLSDWIQVTGLLRLPLPLLAAPLLFQWEKQGCPSHSQEPHLTYFGHTYTYTYVLLFRRVRDAVERIASSISLSVLPVSMKHLENFRMEFHSIRYWKFLLKCIEAVQFLLQSDRFAWSPVCPDLTR